MSQNDPTPRFTELLENLLDRAYNSVAGAVVSTIARGITSGVISTRLRQLEAEAARLTASGETFGVDNPVLRALLADYESELTRFGGRSSGASEDLAVGAESAAARFARQSVIGIVTRWNTPDPEAVAIAADYTARPEWQAEVAKYTADGVEDVRRIIIRGIIAGHNPRRIARDIRRIVESYPRYRAENMMRTLQMTAYREANAAHQRANADILSYQIRIATLDHRVCLCCIGLHGTTLAVGERVDDHNAGRCTSIAIVRGHEYRIQTGEEWFASQSADRQREIAGDANYEAMRAGRVQLRDFQQTYQSPVYGRMLREPSLVGLIGQEARRFYSLGV